MTKLLDVVEVAERIGVPVATIYQWVHYRRIPAVKVTPRMLRFRVEDIEAWLQSRSQAAETGARPQRPERRKAGRPRGVGKNQDVKDMVNRARKEVLHEV